jgi:hypothetical protein
MNVCSAASVEDMASKWPVYASGLHSGLHRRDLKVLQSEKAKKYQKKKCSCDWF